MNPSSFASWLDVFVLAVVQGLTEFLPISSSGHLVLSQTLLRMNPPGVTLELVLHLGTLLAVVLYYRRDLIGLCGGVTRYVGGRRDGENRRAWELAWLLILGTIPAVIGALLFGDRVEAAFSDPRAVCALLMVTGMLLLSTLLVKRGERLPGAPDAVVIGLFQMFALLPGISRSGSTISGGLFRGIRSEEAARFSFLLSIPAILGALVFKIKELNEGFHGHDALLYVEGLVVSFLLGYLSIGWLLRVVRRGRFGIFGIYCLCVGLGGFLLLTFGGR